MSREEKYKGWHVVWTQEVMDYHLSQLPRGFVPKRDKFKTRCGRRVTCPVIHTPEFTQEIVSGTKLCPKCFKSVPNIANQLTEQAA